mgnify:CR=1 FL=1
MDTLKFEGKPVKLVFDQYRNNGCLAVCLVFADGGNQVISKNLWDPEDITTEKPTDEFCAFIDTNNMGDEICDWLEQNNIGTFTNNFGFSGFCMYPEFKFEPSIIEQNKFAAKA